MDALSTHTPSRTEASRRAKAHSLSPRLVSLSFSLSLSLSHLSSSKAGKRLLSARERRFVSTIVHHCSWRLPIVDPLCASTLRDLCALFVLHQVQDVKGWTVLVGAELPTLPNNAVEQLSRSSMRCRYRTAC